MQFKLPELGEGVYEAEVVRWLVQPGDVVRPGQTLLEVLTDKATMEVPAPFAGVIQRLLVEPEQKLSIGQEILEYGSKEKEPAGAEKKKTNGKDSERPATEKEDAEGRSPDRPALAQTTAPGPDSRSKPPAKQTVSGNGRASTVKAAPSVRLMARKLGIDLATIHGSGPGGRILVDDLVSHAPPVGKPQSQAPVADYGRPGTVVKFAGVRRKVAEHMVESKKTIPHYAYVDECDVTDLVKLRESLKETSAANGIKLTYLAFFVRAAMLALKDVPIVNATLKEEAGEIVLHSAYHIGIAVATPSGLIVPVIRDADKKSLVDLAKEIERLSNDARQSKIRLDDLRGATFSITSIGNIGGLFATPIIPPGQAAILGVGKIVKRPVYDEHGQIKPADMVYLSFSFDHRILDGAVGAAFGNAVIRHLQNPAARLL
ncbi:MAG: 2-oxo acid dehydrogenase subunit E2 [Planctomycetes bacterium]|nr:2-oxo acid dehydrogenase subunit E2 [Planctomycetota bacterium]